MPLSETDKLRIQEKIQQNSQLGVNRPMRQISQQDLDSIKAQYANVDQEMDEASRREAEANTPRYQQWLKQKEQYEMTYGGQPRLAGTMF